MRMVSRSVLMFLIGGSLAGCRGFAHVSVIVPPLEVNLDVTDVNLQGRPIDVVRPAYYGETEAFLDLVKAPVPVEGVLYDWRRVLVKEGHYIRVLFPQEWRHIGVPVFVPLRPSAEAMRSRTIFVRLNSDGDLYRVSVVGDKAVVKCTSLPHARAKLPSSLSGTRPEAGSRELLPWIEAEIRFYDSAHWTTAARVAVSGLRRRSETDVLSLRVASEKHPATP